MTNKIFRVEYPYETTGELKRSAQKIISLLEEISDETSLENVSEPIADAIIFSAEKIDLSLRSAQENRADDDPFIDETPAGNQPVTVEFDGRKLTVKTPLTLKRSGIKANDKFNYMLMNYVRAALRQWQEENNFSLYKAIDWPVTAFIIRKGNGYKIRKICDNDNIENGRIINEIFSALGYSDNVRIMDIYSKYECAASRSDIGTEFILVPKRDKDTLNAVIYRQ